MTLFLFSVEKCLIFRVSAYIIHNNEVKKQKLNCESISEREEIYEVIR